MKRLDARQGPCACPGSAGLQALVRIPVAVGMAMLNIYFRLTYLAVDGAPAC